MTFCFFDNLTDKPCARWISKEYLEEHNLLSQPLIVEQIKNLTDAFKRHDLDIDAIWHNFEAIFKVLKGIVTYRPNFELYNDNVMYVEIRSSLTKIYERNGITYDPLETTEIYKRIVDKFVKEIIYSVYRDCKSNMKKMAETFKKIKSKYPNFVVGFDLVGQEDTGDPLSKFYELLMDLGNAGETNWWGRPADENLFDAILLNTGTLY